MKYPALTYMGKARDFSPVRSMISISGDSEVLIENCGSIIECNDIKCSVSAAGYLIDVWGSELTLTSFANGNAGVFGKIQSVSIEKKSARGKAEI
jgi:hypothetical protein